MTYTLCSLISCCYYSCQPLGLAVNSYHIIILTDGNSGSTVRISNYYHKQ